IPLDSSKPRNITAWRLHRGRFILRASQIHSLPTFNLTPSPDSYSHPCRILQSPKTRRRKQTSESPEAIKYRKGGGISRLQCQRYASTKHICFLPPVLLNVFPSIKLFPVLKKGTALV